MINFKQKELSQQLFDKLKTQYPEIELVSIEESPIYQDSIWVNIIMPEDEERDISMSELAAEISTDMLTDYGYDIMISPATSI
jgi:hypothetical protein